MRRPPILLARAERHDPLLGGDLRGRLFGIVLGLVIQLLILVALRVVTQGQGFLRRASFLGLYAVLVVAHVGLLALGERALSGQRLKGLADLDPGERGLDLPEASPRRSSPSAAARGTAARGQRPGGNGLPNAAPAARRQDPRRLFQLGRLSSRSATMA